jgi:hypothetical protein
MELSTDQLEFQDLARRFLADVISSDYIRQRHQAGLRTDPDLLVTLGQLGLSEAFSGQIPAYGIPELGVLFSELGRSLCPEPIGERVLCDAVLPQLLSKGSRERLSGLSPDGAATAIASPRCCSLSFGAATGRLNGELTWAFGAEGANQVIAFVECRGSMCAAAVKLGQSGVEVAPAPSLDLTHSLSSVTLRDAECVLLEPLESSRILHVLYVVKACEVYGITSRVVEMTVDYLRTREQFGVPIGAFQALQQKIADTYATSESLGALSRFAAWSAVQSDRDQAALTASAAISQASEIGPLICEAAIQCHGGIGFTWEFDLHLFLRRVRAISAGFPLSAQVGELLAQR